MSRYKGQWWKALYVAYPSHPWQRGRFVKMVPSGHWRDLKNVRQFVDKLANNLDIKQVILINLQTIGSNLPC